MLALYFLGLYLLAYFLLVLTNSPLLNLIVPSVMYL